MDGRDRLRRYLEQRRDAGERELVLDSMTVDEVMRLVAGFPRDRGTASIGESAAREHPTGATSGSDAPTAAAPSDAPAADAGDWRAILASAVGDIVVPRPVERLADSARATPESIPSSAAAHAQVDPDTRQRAGESAVPPSPPSVTGSLSPSPPASGVGETWPAGLIFGRTGADLFGGPLAAHRTLDDVARAVAACTACPLYSTAIQSVPGEGSPTASLVCVGEAPGATEDETGRPFVGAAGKLLDKILAAIDLARENVFICNVLKHRPPGNRNPLPTEVAACTPFLVRQLELIRPRVILAFGSFAAQTLLETTQPIGKLRGAVHWYYGVPLIATYHPAALLRNPAWKRPTWEDVQYARRILDGTGV